MHRLHKFLTKQRVSLIYKLATLVVVLLCCSRPASAQLRFSDPVGLDPSQNKLVELVNYASSGAGVLLPLQLVNPTTVVFGRSPDHDVVEGGTEKVTGYTIDVLNGGGTSVASRDIGKPTPVNGEITYTGLRTITTGLANGNYVVVVTAFGPGGRSDGTAPSATFSVAATTSRPAAPVGPAIIRQ